MRMQYHVLYSSKNVDWLSFFTQRVLDDLVSHLRIFRKTLKTCREEHGMIMSPFTSQKVTLCYRIWQDKGVRGRHILC